MNGRAYTTYVAVSSDGSEWIFGGACGVVTWNTVRGATLLECLLGAVLTLAKKGDRRYLKKTYVVEDWKYSET